MKIDLVINTVSGAGAQRDSYSIRRTTLTKGYSLFHHDIGGQGSGARHCGHENKNIAGKVPSGVSYAMTQKIPMTKEGYEKLKQELDRIKKVERGKNIRDIEEARSHGDISENAEYHAAKERQGFLDAKMRELENKLSHAQIIDLSKLSNEKVVFGATVSLIDTDSGDPRKYTLVGQEEADLKKGKISVQSPVGKALIGHKVGDIVTIKTPAKTVEYEIQGIEISFE
jgi:transcription elongation factor GreA